MIFPVTNDSHTSQGAAMAAVLAALVRSFSKLVNYKSKLVVVGKPKSSAYVLD